MKKKIEGKIKAAHLWGKITIIAAVILVAAIVLSAFVDNGSMYIGAAVFVQVVCIVTYFGFRRNILTSSKLLLDKGVTIDEVAADLDDSKTIGKMAKFKCGKKFFSISSPFSIFAYSDIAWVYGKKTTHMNTGTGATTTNKTVIFCTVQGKKYTTYVSWKATKKFLEENQDKFSPELIVGYKMKYNKQYKEIVKNSK